MALDTPLILAAKKIICTYFVVHTTTMHLFYATNNSNMRIIDAVFDCGIAVRLQDASNISNKSSTAAAHNIFLVENYSEFR